MKNAEFLQKIKEIGWFDCINPDGVTTKTREEAQAYLLERLKDKEAKAHHYYLSEDCFDESQLYAKTQLVEYLLKESGVNPLDYPNLTAKEYIYAQDMFDDINEVLLKNGIKSAYYILPNGGYEDIDYVFKPIEIFEKAVALGLINYNIDTEIGNIKAVLFDLDGTLIDTAPDFIRIIKVMCAKHSHPVPSDDAIREQVSAGARAMVKLMFGELVNVADDDKKLLAYRQEFLDTYEADICVDSQLFNGLDNLLIELENAGIPWGIVTNKPRYLAEILLEKLNLTERCSVLVCPDDVKNSKPDPEPMFLAVKILNEKLSLNLTPQDCVYVGDHIRDIEAGNNAGMVTFLAAYGYIPPQDQADLSVWGADVIVHNTHELYQAVCDLVFN